jgi:hypothetical protein
MERLMVKIEILSSQSQRLLGQTERFLLLDIKWPLDSWMQTAQLTLNSAFGRSWHVFVICFNNTCVVFSSFQRLIGVEDEDSCGKSS